MQIYVENRLHERGSATVGDDAEDSFMSACRAAPEGSVMSGVQSYGDTMLNQLQLVQFIVELERLPREKKTGAVFQVAELARQAVASGGYLYVSGD
ncbi:hypothetical protein RB200_02800 [Streptomyces sp. PmtG]